jgi:hypothetical protein
MNEKNTAQKYREYILAVLDTVYARTDYPQKKDFAIEVAKAKTTAEDLKHAKYTPEQVRPSVSKAIDRLCLEKDSPILRYKKYYVRNTSKHLFEKLSEEYAEYLRDRIIVENPHVLLISHNMCAFWASENPEYGKEAIPLDANANGAEVISVKSSENEQRATVHEYIAECLGDNSYAVFGQDNFIYAMVMCSSDPEPGIIPGADSREFVVIRALEDAIRRLYKEKRIQLKKKKAN